MAFGTFTIIKKCKTTNARVSEFVLAKNTLHLPIFMPVATYGAMRCVPVASMPEEIILSNTYHLRNLNRNVKEFIGWERSLLTDSGGFQIQSLPNVQVVDEGVRFDDRLFTPEESMDIQIGLGADVMMQLDDVVNPMEDRKKHEEAVDRSLAWLDRAILQIETANKQVDETVNKRIKPNKPTIHPFRNQILFPIIQGGLEEDLRMRSIKGILERRPLGIAIGGLSGGENKGDFCKTVLLCCKSLPPEMPRYLMGVGYPEDVVVCCALGTDMSDCVYPTRTARFGRAFRDEGDFIVTGKVIGGLSPLDESCECATCRHHNVSYLATIRGTPNFCMLLSVHNMHYMRNLTKRIREAIERDCFPEFIKKFMKKRYKEEIPEWIKEAMGSVGVIFDELLL